MGYAKQMIKEYIEAGFIKIHIDTSMPLKNENTIDYETIAKRTALLCKVAEESFEMISFSNPNAIRPVYVIGADVPPPGGDSSAMQIFTTKKELEKSLNYFDPEKVKPRLSNKRKFKKNG